MRGEIFLSLGIVLILTCQNIFADENPQGGFSELEGFGEEIISKESAVVETKESSFKLSGDLAFKIASGYKNHTVDAVGYSGVNQAQTSLYLQLDTKLFDSWKLRVSGDGFYDAIYDIKSDNSYNDEILSAYRTQLRLDDTYISGKVSSKTDLKVGRQIVVWGKSDSIRVTDVINPLDNRLPGMTDIEDLRLSVGMAKLDYYIGSWNLSLMGIFENRIMLEAAPRSEFFPVDEVFAGAPNPFFELQTPEGSDSDAQYAFAINGTFSGWDLSFYSAHVLDQKWHIDPVDNIRKVGKIDMLGSALNIAAGSWLVKGEAAYLKGVRYNSTVDEKNRLDILLGIDYMGFRDTVFSVEVANRHIFEYEAKMQGGADFVDEDETQTAIRLTRSFANDTVNATALVSMFGQDWEYGGFGRVWVEYELGNALSANFGVVDYIGGDKPFMSAIENNDRVFADITYSF